ncbi:hypothetical protein A2331_03495 [Candidatus Falkowbacteria bacterium RIFOXYB2_FULL_34_18]|uniref:Uncharacterized protein n=1 Tax=Candidatus Falkowbacteria bacterium RIFOXYD2_FULL_34_120 TaxID=1798007 RepID=A0A1F5TSQ7_9BACT|nr:MAG: hypothetical protein A2331_03495 [Candidatus Falkowbacteria bacterium RIFOXYB2_FULL_34_18]OGF30113.1 MAG: hypothetical protein A2500_04955 [Candidatus Falkowbacteria bacterium RIFOXYC12_FULL_34_55]OGF37553.1 MAG: hypothetical protein A2466_01890 [Candidatus Falkowbacteria bacterium RIFOXYC2_FULL_34_220]OGF39309.1 MAG: hypothetical protein A2515_02305 [Candidatus Falkowbacteria bacterium RIFOXYD12_FULL_34_57]OGF41814.1 MAG: hypothetical protein A2531_05290 [Candidatus Falkowbacteria bact
MSNVIQRKSEKTKKAIEYISEEKKNNPNRKIFDIINEASLKFDLSPKEEQFLYKNFSEK